MSEGCLVTIIMPVYKTEEFIEKSILSVQNQTYKNIELICVDDGTPDKAFEICRKMQKDYPDMILLQNPLHKKEGTQEGTRNHGQEYTRNHGLEHTTGKYVLYLDSDDTLAPDAIENLVEVAEKNNSDVVMFTLMRIIDGKQVPSYCDKLSEGSYTIKELAPHIFSNIDLGVLCCVGSKLYNVDFINKHHLRFDEKYKYNEDGGFILNFLLKEPKVYFLNKPYYEYLIRSCESTMSSYRPKMFNTMVKVREICKGLFKKAECWSKPEIQREYFREMLALMLNSLVNEVKFGNKRSFNNAYDTIRNYEGFNELAQYYEKNGGTTKERRLMLYLIKNNCKLFTRIFVKAWVALK